MADPNGRPEGFVRFEREALAQSIPDRFRYWVRRDAEHPAVKVDAQAMGYGELDDLTDRIAAVVLDAAGDGPEPVVLLCTAALPHIAAQLGVLKAGKPVVPIDPTFPPARVAAVLQDSEARLILTDSANAPLAAELGGPCRAVVDLEADELPPPDSVPQVQVPPDAPAYIFYTSGSTGQPKGVVLTHRSLLHVPMVYNHELGICPTDRVACPTSLSYTGTVWALLAALMNGAAYVSCDFSTPEHLVEAMAREEVTFVQLIVPLFRHVVSSLQDGVSLQHLRLVYTGGEGMYWADVDAFRRAFPAHTRLAHIFGSTEAGIMCSFPVPWGDGVHRDPGGVVPCGLPMEDKEVLILTDDGGEVAEGDVGEIAIRSRYLLHGYWQRPERTEAAFIPQLADGAVRVFRTGDMGRRLPDGCLAHMGRKDFEVKVRGHRANIRDVESALRGIEGVSAAVAVTRKDQFGDAYLVAYLATDGGRPLGISGLRARLGELVPDFMVPSRFVFLDALPVAGTGKVDRAALPEPPHERPELDTPFEPPQTPVEVLLAGLWSELLNVSPIGIHDSFFDLGGTSLTTIRLAARVRAALGVAADVQTFFASPTVAGLAQAVVARLAGDLSPDELDSLLRDAEGE